MVAYRHEKKAFDAANSDFEQRQRRWRCPRIMPLAFVAFVGKRAPRWRRTRRPSWRPASLTPLRRAARRYRPVFQLGRREWDRHGGVEDQSGRIGRPTPQRETANRLSAARCRS